MSNLLNIPTFQGFTLNGVFRGCRVQKGRPNQQGVVRETVKCGIEVTRTDAYGQPATDTLELTISDKLVQQGVPAKLAAFAGTEISLPFYSSGWIGTKGDVGITNYLANEILDLFK